MENIRQNVENPTSKWKRVLINNDITPFIKDVMRKRGIRESMREKISPILLSDAEKNGFNGLLHVVQSKNYYSINSLHLLPSYNRKSIKGVKAL